MRSFKTILFASLLLVAMSCSTIINGSRDEIDIQSNPSSATVFVNFQELGPTPALLRLERGETHIIEVKKAGFQTYRITTRRGLNGWFWGNLFVCGGIPGMVVDLITGNAYDVEPQYINAMLNKDNAMNKFYELENYNGIHLADTDGNNLGDIKIVWE